MDKIDFDKKKEILVNATVEIVKTLIGNGCMQAVHDPKNVNAISLAIGVVYNKLKECYDQ